MDKVLTEKDPRETALEEFKKGYEELVKKHKWDIGATLQVVNQSGKVEVRPTFVDISQIK